jgi:UDP-N-acetylmuramate dehydrogenase
MQIHEAFSLLPYNTFRIDVKARYFSTFTNTDELAEVVAADSRLPTFILGGGSNILFTKDYDGLCFKK